MSLIKHFNLQRVQKPSQQRLLSQIVNALPSSIVRDKSHDISVTSHINGSVIILNPVSGSLRDATVTVRSVNGL